MYQAPINIWISKHLVDTEPGPRDSCVALTYLDSRQNVLDHALPPFRPRPDQDLRSSTCEWFEKLLDQKEANGHASRMMSGARSTLLTIDSWQWTCADRTSRTLVSGCIDGWWVDCIEAEGKGGQHFFTSSTCLEIKDVFLLLLHVRHLFSV